MTLQLLKLEEGLSSGAIIFHEFVKKTPEEVKMLRENIEHREALHKQRRVVQEANVESFYAHAIFSSGLGDCVEW